MPSSDHTEFLKILLAVIGVAGAIVAAIVAHLNAIRKVRQELEIAVETARYGQRVAHYQSLLEKLECLARYPWPDPPSFEKLKEFSLGLKSWYFTAGGLYMTPETREVYFDLQFSVKGLLEKHNNSSFFTPNDFRNFLALATWVAVAKNDASRFFLSQLSNTCRESLTDFQKKTDRERIEQAVVPKGLQRDLIEMLNEQLRHIRLWEQSPFSKYVSGVVPETNDQNEVVAYNRAIVDKSLQDIQTRKTNEDLATRTTLDPKRFAELRDLGSQLRTRISNEILSRLQSRLNA